MTKQENNLSLTEYPSVYWQKFFDKFGEIEQLPINKWETVHLIAYFCKRYKDHYNINFSFKFNSNSPSKSYELFQIRKISQMLSSDITILKEYIDWFFENKIILKKKRITSLSFFSDANVVNEFKFKKMAMDKSQNIERSTRLPDKFLQIVANSGIGMLIQTYGDLAWVYLTSRKTHEQTFENLSKSGLNLEMLKKIK